MVFSHALMVVTRSAAGRFQVLWSIKDLAEQHYAKGDEIGRWMHFTRRAYYNGPLPVESVIPVAAAETGHPRFLVRAVQGADILGISSKSPNFNGLTIC
jgi:hypothetical protein